MNERRAGGGGGTDAGLAPGGRADYGLRPPGWRLPGDTHVGRVRLQVGDLARSLAYYGDTLGLRVLDRDSDRVTLAAHGSDAALVELHEHRDARPVPRHGRLGLYHFAILLPDRAALGRLIGHLADLGESMGAADHLVSEAIYLTDPDGLGIEVYADRPREEWKHEGRQLSMDTQALDVPDLLREAGGVAWTGMPAGTTIGHVHLHVGDLEASKRFYHDGVGLDLLVWSYPRALFLAAGGYHHHLGINTWAGTRAAPPAPDDAQLLEWELVVPRAADVSSVVHSVREAGFEARDELLRDPSGTPLRVIAGT